MIHMKCQNLFSMKKQKKYWFCLLPILLGLLKLKEVNLLYIRLVSHIQHKYFSPWNKCLGNLASYVFQRICRLQYILFDVK